MEIRLLHERFTEKDPKLLMDYIRRMASGETPFFPTTLSMIYDKLVENAFPSPTFSSVLSESTGNQSVTTPAPPVEASTSASSTSSPSTSCITSSSILNLASLSNSKVPNPTPAGPTPLSTTTERAWLKCVRCGEQARLRELHDGLHCPLCSGDGKNGKGKGGRPFMQCLECNRLRVARTDQCLRRNSCRAKFM